MTLEIEDSKNYYVICLDVLGTKNTLTELDYNKVNEGYRFFQRSVNEVINFKIPDEITSFILIGDSLYFICEQLKTALYVIKLFGYRCIQFAIDYEKREIDDLPSFMVRGGISYGSIVFYHPDDDKNIYTSNQINNPFNAIGLPIGKAYVLSEKSKGMRVAVDFEPMDEYEKYFSKQCDFQGVYYYELLWPLCIFNKKSAEYILDSLNAFWHLFEINRGDHEIQYLSTLALFWKSVELTSHPSIAEDFFGGKLDEYPDEIDYIGVLKKYDFFIRLNYNDKMS
jgi:hypothetical protein